MELLQSIAATAAVLLILGACVVVMLWNGGTAGAGAVLLEQMLRRQGDEVARVAIASGDRNFALAVGQCTRCNEAAQCRAWLQSGASDGYQTFCPNAGYVRRMKLLAC